MQNKTIYRQDYQPYPFAVLSIDLSIDLFEEHAEVTSRLKVKRELPGEFLLYGDELELVSIHLDDQELPKSAYQLQNSNLLIPACPDEFTLTTVVKIHPEKNTTLSGLYRSNRIFCTQCEAEGFRRITFFPDRPDVLTSYTTRISADKKAYPILLSNGNRIDSGETDDGRHWVLWEDPFKKPSYLFALVAGDLACLSDTFVTQSGKKVDLRIYVEHGNETQCFHAMDSLKHAMRWDEEAFGREYDLNTFMIVAVSDFNMGAMENKGLNIFNSKYILVSPETAIDENYAEVESVVGHEYFHNWTGNRITCRDWFQLSLKEGLTVFREHEFSADMNSRDVNRIAEVRTLRTGQFPEDAGAMAHPVRPESYQEINNFYTATVYNKGAEVIRMQHTLLGKEGFRRGMDLYFERFDGQAVTIDDFVQSMEDANHVDLTQFKRWYSQAGTPEVKVDTDFQNGCLSLTLSQTCPPTAECKDKKPFHIPIRMALWSKEGKLIEETLLELKEPQTVYRFEGLKAQPYLSLLRDFSAPIKLHYSQTEDELLTLLKYETNGYSKWNAGQALALNTLSSWMKSPASTWSLPPKLIEAYIHILNDESLDMGLRAELLTPPHFEEVAATRVHVEADKIEQVRDVYREALGKALFEHTNAMYKTLWEQEDGKMNYASFARRKLRNRCLWLMMKGNEKEALPLCLDLFENAPTMTGKLASFILLVDCADKSLSDKAIHAFYQEWSRNDLVMDKWFSVQASAEAPDTLQKVKKLLTHLAFQIKNPNKVRALIGAFAQFNPRYFHALESLWSNIHCHEVFNTSNFELGKSVFRNLGQLIIKQRRSGYLLDTSPLHSFVPNHINFERISNNINEKRLETLEIITNCYETEQIISFYQHFDPTFQNWSYPRHISEAAVINENHIIASGSIPLFFPPMLIDDLHYGDGSVGLISPLRGALRFNVEKILVIGTRQMPTPRIPEKNNHDEIGFGQVLGNMLNGVFLDNLDRDIEMVNRMNEIAALLSIWKKYRSPWRPIETLYLRPSMSMAKLAQEHYKSMPALLRMLLNVLGAKYHSGDLLSFLLFEKEFTALLLEAGYTDTMNQYKSVLEFFE